MRPMSGSSPWDAARSAPQRPQNLAASSLGSPQLGQRIARGDTTHGPAAACSLRMRRLWLVVFLVFAASCGSVPPATRSQRAQVQVVLYTTRWCPVCAQARGWLDSRGVNYWERDV